MKLYSGLAFALFIPQILAAISTTIIHPTPVPEVSDITWTDSNGFDAAKVQPVNASTYDWWYFDAVQVSDDPAQQASVVITLYTAVSTGFDFLQAYAAQGFTSLTLAEVIIHWPNGTAESYFFNSTEARITTNTADNGVHGVWIDNPDKISFMGSPGMTTWQVEIDSAAWISGTVTLQSIAPRHYPCGPLASGENMQVAPHVGWANAVPDAQANVQLTVNGRPLNFTGIGYHDKNWGDKNFVSSVGSWYWGHGRLGPYSIVWFDFLSPERENFVSAYVARDNKILVSQCSGITVRPYGENSTYPPLASTGNPSGFNINIDLPDGSQLDFKASAERMVAGDAPGSRYARFTGTLEGSVDGEALTGETLFEHFHIFEK